MLAQSLERGAFRAMNHLPSLSRLRLPARLAAFLRCARAGSAVEFAILCPVFLTLVLGMFEAAWVMYIQSAIEGALRQGARYGITGQGSDDVARKAAIIAEINNYTFGSVVLTDSDVDERVYQSFDEVGLPEPWVDANGNGQYDVGETYTELNGVPGHQDDRGVSGVGGTGSIVRYTVTYMLPALTGFVQAFTGGIHLTATTVVQNEPYSGS
jgi:hypothetical protein